MFLSFFGALRQAHVPVTPREYLVLMQALEADLADHSVEDFYRRFYFRAPKIAAIVGEMIRSPQMMKRRLREGVEFFRFLRERQEPAH